MLTVIKLTDVESELGNSFGEGHHLVQGKYVVIGLFHEFIIVLGVELLDVFGFHDQGVTLLSESHWG